jgi:hypothetical protein
MYLRNNFQNFTFECKFERSRLRSLERRTLLTRVQQNEMRIFPKTFAFSNKPYNYTKLMHKSITPTELVLKNSYPRYFTSLPSTENTKRGDGDEPEKTQTKNQKLKQLFVKYGKIAVGVHIGLSLISLGIWYTLIANQVIDVQAVGTYLGINVGDCVKSAPSSFGIAYVLHKASVPFRIPISLICIPIVAKITNKEQNENTPSNV